MLSSCTNVYGIIGNPIIHSMSPILHNYMFKIHHINAVYVAFQSNNIKEAIDGVRGLNIKGVNITLPFKEETLHLVDIKDKDAEVIKSINTIKSVDGVLYGFNTDFLGFYDMFNNKIDYKDKNITVLGAGGSSKAIIYALHKLGIQNINVLNRTIQKAYIIKENFKGLININCSTLEDKKVIKSSNIIINTTSVGLDGISMPIEINSIENSIIIDIIYKETQLIKQAKKMGLQTFNGLEMFINQAYYSFKIWTNVQFDKNKALKLLMRKM